jgi:hypothetical protein
MRFLCDNGESGISELRFISTAEAATLGRKRRSFPGRRKNIGSRNGRLLALVA